MKKVLLGIGGIALATWLALHPISKEQRFQKFIGALNQCSIAEEQLERYPTETNKKILAKTDKNFSSIDSKFKDIDWKYNEGTRSIDKKVAEDFAKRGYFLDKGIRFFEDPNQKYSPITLGKIVEEGTFNDIKYIAYERKIGDWDRVACIERNANLCKIYSGGEKNPFISINKSFIENEAIDLFNEFKGKKSVNNLNANEKLKYAEYKRICNEIKNPKKEKEFCERYWQIQKKVLCAHEIEHLSTNSELRASLKSLQKEPSYATLECLMRFLNHSNSKEYDGDKHKEAAKQIFLRFKREGYSPEKLYELKLDDISRIAGKIYKKV